MATKREQTLLHNRTAQGLVLVSSFICMGLAWVWLYAQESPTWIDWVGFIAPTVLFSYCLSITIKGRRIRRNERSLAGRNE